MGSLKYAVAGAAVGLGDQMVKMADERRKIANAILLQKNRADAATAIRDENRGYFEEDRDISFDRNDFTYGRGLEDSREDAALLRGERAGARSSARTQFEADRQERRDYQAGLLESSQEREDEQAEANRGFGQLDRFEKEDRAARLRKEKQEREDAVYKRNRTDFEEDRDKRGDDLTGMTWKRGDDGRETLYGLNPETKQMEIVRDEEGKPFTRAGQSGGEGMKSADSNAIARAIGTAYGGNYDPVSGTFSGLNKGAALEALAAAARAEQIWMAAQAGNRPIGHRAAANQAMKEARATGPDPMGLFD